MKALSIDTTNRNATIQLCYSPNPKINPGIKIKTGFEGSCTPALVENSTAKFSLKTSNLKCSQTYQATWSVFGVTPEAGQSNHSLAYSVVLPDSTTTVTVSVTVNFDDGISASDTLTFTPLSQEQARFFEFICNLKKERMKPHPWWEFDPAIIRKINNIYSINELIHVERGMETILQKIKQLIQITKDQKEFH